MVLLNRYAKTIFSKKSKLDDSSLSLYRTIALSDYYTLLSILSLKTDGNTLLQSVDLKSGTKLAKGDEQLDDNQYTYDLINIGYEIDNYETQPNPVILRSAKTILEYYYKFQSLDIKLNKLVYLLAFLNKEFFGENYIYEHLTYLFRYFKTDISFSNINNFQSKLVEIEDLRLVSKSYIILRDNMYDNDKDCLLYLMKLPENQVTRIKLSEVLSSDFQYLDLKLSLLDGTFDFIREFYMYANFLKDNEENKQIVIENMKKIANLHKESYSEFLRNLDIQTLKYGL